MSSRERDFFQFSFQTEAVSWRQWANIFFSFERRRPSWEHAVDSCANCVLNYYTDALFSLDSFVILTHPALVSVPVDFSFSAPNIHQHTHRRG